MLSSESRKVKKFATKAAVVSGVSLGSLVVLLGGLAAHHISSRTSDLPAVLVKAQQVGIPVDETEFMEFRGGADDGEASELVSKAEDLLISDIDALRYTMARNLDADDLDDAEFRDHIAKLEPALTIIEQLAQRPDCRFSLEPSTQGVRFLEVRTLRNAARVLSNRARMHAVLGQGTAATNDVLTIKQLARHLRGGFHFRNLTASVDLDAIAMTVLAEFITEPGIDGKLATDAAQMLAEYEVEADLLKTFKGEAFVHWTITGSVPIADEDPLALFKRIEQDFLRREVLTYNVDKVKSISAAAQDLPSIEAASVKQQNGYSSTEPALRYIVSTRDSSLLVLRAYGRNLARREMMRAMLEVVQGKGAAEEWPAKLQLQTRDPYRDAPLVYVRTSEGFDIVSFGRDGKDDKGETTRAFSNGPEASDLILSIRSDVRPRLRGR